MELVINTTKINQNDRFLLNLEEIRCDALLCHTAIICHLVSWTVTPLHPLPRDDSVLHVFPGHAPECLGMPAFSTCPGDPDNGGVLHGP